MTVRKGEQWGDLRTPPDDLTVVGSDAELRTMISDRNHPPIVGLRGGDLMRTLGGTGDRTRFTTGEPVPHLPIDVVRVVLDERRDALFVAHLVARHSWWRGSITAAMNAQFIGQWDVSPRCHPNDGKVDVVTVSADFGWRERWMARSRLKLGTHVPHPSIAIAQRDHAVIELEAETPVWLDGDRWGRGRHLELTVVPDKIVVCV
jgi:hypothetical protein